MKVLKFGGTSVGSVKSILSLKRIVEKEAKRQPIVVVVSALGGITDQLISTSRLAQEGKEEWKEQYEQMVDRHHKMIDTIITDTSDREELFNKVDALFEQLHSIYFGVYLIHDLSKKTLDAIVSYGERLSSNIVSTLVKGSRWMDSRNFIKTTTSPNGKTVLDSELTNRLVKEAFKDADIVYPKSWASFAAMERRTDLYGKGDFEGIDKLEKELLAENATHKDWECTEEMMELTKDGKALYLHCLPADITDVSCKEGEVAASVFDRYRAPLYKEASYKPYVIAAMIFLAKVKDPAKALEELEAKGKERKKY